MVSWLLLCVLLLPAPVCAGDLPALQDPLRPLLAAPRAAGAAVEKKAVSVAARWQLDAVLLGSERAVALINGQPYQVDALLGGYRVKKIESDRVLLQKGNQMLVLRRSSTGLKKARSRAAEGSQP